MKSDPFEIKQSSACGDKLAYDKDNVMKDIDVPYDSTKSSMQSSYPILGMKSTPDTCAVTCTIKEGANIDVAPSVNSVTGYTVNYNQDIKQGVTKNDYYAECTTSEWDSPTLETNKFKFKQRSQCYGLL